MPEAPLSELAGYLAVGDLTAAGAVLAGTPWTNLANVLKSLPERDQARAYRLLDCDAAVEVLADLSPAERRRLLAASDAAERS